MYIKLALLTLICISLLAAGLIAYSFGLTPLLTPTPGVLRPIPTPPPPLTVTDREALTALYHATDGSKWEKSENWLTDKPLGTWHGVTTNDAGRVTELRLRTNNLNGTIPPELGSLFELTLLVLNRISGWNDGYLTGSIPPELGNLSNLVVLGLKGNKLSGPIPLELVNLSNLEVMDLESNNLMGEIPPEFKNLSNLVELHLCCNELTGPIPPGLGTLPDLRTINLSGNELDRHRPTGTGKSS